MAKINVAPEIKKEYNRARKSFIQKATRASNRGYILKDRLGFIVTGQKYAQQIAPSLSSIVRDKEGKSEAELSEYVKQATQRIITERQEFYESPYVDYIDPITELTFYGNVGKSIENRRNKEKFLSRGKANYKDDFFEEYDRLYEDSIDAEIERQEKERILKDWTAGTKELLDRISDNELEQEYDPTEFYSDRDDRGTGEPPTAVDSVIDNVQNELKRWTTDAEKKYEEEQAEQDKKETENVLFDLMHKAQAEGSLQGVENDINEWTPQANWTPTLEECKRRDRDTAENVLISAIEEYGREAIAWNIENNASRVISLLQSILYASGSKEGNFKDGRTQVNADIVEFKELITGHKLTLEESERYTRMAERNELNE